MNKPSRDGGELTTSTLSTSGQFVPDQSVDDFISSVRQRRTTSTHRIPDSDKQIVASIKPERQIVSPAKQASSEAINSVLIDSEDDTANDHHTADHDNKFTQFFASIKSRLRRNSNEGSRNTDTSHDQEDSIKHDNKVVAFFSSVKESVKKAVRSKEDSDMAAAAAAPTVHDTSVQVHDEQQHQQQQEEPRKNKVSQIFADMQRTIKQGLRRAPAEAGDSKADDHETSSEAKRPSSPNRLERFVADIKQKLASKKNEDGAAKPSEPNKFSKLMGSLRDSVRSKKKKSGDTGVRDVDESDSDDDRPNKVQQFFSDIGESVKKVGKQILK